MRSFNSTKKFNSVFAAKGDEPRKSLTHLANNGYHFHAEDPENNHVPRSAEATANHYLLGCHHSCGADSECNGGNSRLCRSRCSDKCGGSYKQQGLNEPSEEAQDILGLEKGSSGNWNYNHQLSKLKNYANLGDVLNMEVTNKNFPNLRGLKVSSYAWNPKQQIAEDRKGKPILVGQYLSVDHQGNRRPQYAEPMQELGKIESARSEAYKNLIDKGSTNIGDYFKVAKVLNAHAHGISVPPEDYDKGENENFKYLAKDQKPINIHHQLSGVIGNILDHTEPKHPALKALHEKAKTADWVMCHCPRCALDQTLHVSNTVFDMQDHNKAANSSDKALRDAYFTRFPMGASKHLGEGKEGRVSGLGDIGKRTPHRQLWISEHGSTYLHHVKNGRQDENHELFMGNDVAIPMDTPKLDLSALSETSGRNPKFWEKEYSSDDVTPITPGQPNKVKQRPRSESAAEANQAKEDLLNKMREKEK